MDIYIDIELNEGFDDLWVYLEIKNGSKNLIFIKDNIIGMNWIFVLILLSMYVG